MDINFFSKTNAFLVIFAPFENAALCLASEIHTIFVSQGIRHSISLHQAWRVTGWVMPELPRVLILFVWFDALRPSQQLW